MPNAELARELDPHRGYQHPALRLHLSVCAACRRFERHVRFLRSAMQKYRQ